ncbi:MAG: 30S ribosome-binding factor RbfA [Spirochaetaceae bacterium]|jgi:ribosome-binding factor A|nr:30S ribosome-binding factor RbfA [Spirochaetaceae bacterium]
MSEYRSERIGRLIQEKIGALIVEGKIKDPRVHPFLSITRVSVSRDFAWAEVYVSNCKPQGSLSKGVAGLQSAAGFIQSQIAAQMHIRQTPRLRFHEDPSIGEGFALIKKIETLQSTENRDIHEAP